jgi:hypothetical protein
MARTAKTARVLTMPVPMGKLKQYPIHWQKSPKDHPEIHISVSRQDSILWTCNEKKFRVLRVDRHDDPHAPMPLFYRRFPEDNPEFGFQVNSGPAQAGRENHKYKAHFEFEDGTRLDPHIRVDA